LKLVATLLRNERLSFFYWQSPILTRTFLGLGEDVDALLRAQAPRFADPVFASALSYLRSVEVCGSNPPRHRWLYRIAVRNSADFVYTLDPLAPPQQLAVDPSTDLWKLLALNRSRHYSRFNYRKVFITVFLIGVLLGKKNN
jgi:hypothetical protein